MLRAAKGAGQSWLIERKVRMVWLRRAIGVIFATAVAIGAGLVFLPVAALADPVTRAAGFALIQFAVWAPPPRPRHGSFARRCICQERRTITSWNYDLPLFSSLPA